MNNRILIYIPAYNEEKTVGQVAQSLIELYPNYDVLVINDGSTDDTEVKAKEVGAKIITFPFHVGGNVAVITSFLIALKYGYQYLIKIDADGQHKAEDVQRVLQPLIEEKGDICVGSRYLINQTRVEEDSIIKIGGRAFSSSIVNYIVKEVDITDTTSGFRAWNRKALHVLVNEYLNGGRLPDISIFWLFETIFACKKGLIIKEIPIEVLPRMFGKSKSFSFIKMIKYPVNLLKLLIEEMR